MFLTNVTDQRREFYETPENIPFPIAHFGNHLKLIEEFTVNECKISLLIQSEHFSNFFINACSV